MNRYRPSSLIVTRVGCTLKVISGLPIQDSHSQSKMWMLQVSSIFFIHHSYILITLSDTKLPLLYIGLSVIISSIAVLFHTLFFFPSLFLILSFPSFSFSPSSLSFSFHPSHLFLYFFLPISVPPPVLLSIISFLSLPLCQVVYSGDLIVLDYFFYINHKRNTNCFLPFNSFPFEQYGISLGYTKAVHNLHTTL